MFEDVKWPENSKLAIIAAARYAWKVGWLVR
jgi:hypothetical protein